MTGTSRADEYRERFGEDRVLVFSKQEIAEWTDHYDLKDNWASILWARNACWELARRLGLRYFLQLDDDYQNFSYRRTGKYRPSDTRETYHSWSVGNLDKVIAAFVEFLENTPSVQCVCMAQGGDHIGGIDGNTCTRFMRKAMNSFFCDVERPIVFRGRMNEDVNTYVSLGAVGVLFLTYSAVYLVQTPTQSNPGGITDLYLDSGTYQKSFYTILAAPSCTTIRLMGNKHRRMHHHIRWRDAVPMILPEAMRKDDGEVAA
jgi:hypothetical protein